jgi:hypothetical protein
VRVADYHTYLVGARDWGFSIWAHNTGLDGCGGAKKSKRAQEDAKQAMDYEEALFSSHDREFYARSPGLQERYNRALHYPESPTRADRRALGAGPGEVVDHVPPLVQRYYDGDPAIGEPPGRLMTPQERAASAADRTRMRVQTEVESNRQGQEMARWAEQRARELGL